MTRKVYSTSVWIHSNNIVYNFLVAYNYSHSRFCFLACILANCLCAPAYLHHIFQCIADFVLEAKTDHGKHVLRKNIAPFICLKELEKIGTQTITENLMRHLSFLLGIKKYIKKNMTVELCNTCCSRL
jgi:hypothetical protein